MLTSQSPAALAWPVYLPSISAAPRRRCSGASPSSQGNVALYLQKKQGKETEAVTIIMCIIKRKQRQTITYLAVAGGACVARPSPRRHAAPPPAQRRVAFLPPKDVAFFLPKEQGKETEAVNINMCMIKRKQR